MKRWDVLLDKYMVEYSSRGLAKERVKQVRGELDRWGSWLKARRPRPLLEKVDADLIVRYVRDRTVFRAKATVSGIMSVLRGLGEYLVQEGYWESNALRWLRGPKLDPFGRAPKRLGQEGLKRLWAGAAASRERYHRRLWLTVLATMYGTGARRGELERLNLSDWDGESGIVRVDGRKTGRERSVPVSEALGRFLEAYLPHRHNHLEKLGMLDQKSLFVSRYGGRLSGSAISRGIHGIARRSKVRLVSLHQLRHSCASDLLESGACLPEVQGILGHQAISSTVRYLHISDPKRREAMSRHPLNQWLKGEAA